jgi:Flp pilus assembly protein TadB
MEQAAFDQLRSEVRAFRRWSRVAMLACALLLVLGLLPLSLTNAAVISCALFATSQFCVWRMRRSYARVRRLVETLDAKGA